MRYPMTRSGRIPFLLLAVLGAGCASAGSPPATMDAAAPGRAEITASPRGSGTEDMLAGVLPAVVTVAIREEDAYAPRVFGFTEEERTAAGRRAYGGILDLSGFDGSGSGFLMERDGRHYVVTNAHVVQTADPDEIYVFSLDRKRYRMRLVGADTYRDMAVLEFVDAPGSELGTIRIHAGDDLRVGMPVWAVGNPLGEFPYSVTSGVVSGLNRTLGGLVSTVGYLQTDASVTFGNSGGPLVGPAGTVVGLITAGRDGTNINFALEGRHLHRFVDDVIRDGHVVRAFTGLLVQAEPFEDEIRILGALPGSPAAGQAALREGTVLTAINGEPIRAVEDAIAALENVLPGSDVTLSVGSGGASRDVRVRTTALDDEWLIEIGRQTAALFDLSLVQDGEGEVSVVVGMEEVPDDVWTTDDYRLPRAGDQLVLGGVFMGYFEQLWQIRSLKDLGVVTRLGLPTGGLVLVFLGPDGEDVAVGTDTYPASIF